MLDSKKLKKSLWYQHKLVMGDKGAAKFARVNWPACDFYRLLQHLNNVIVIFANNYEPKVLTAYQFSMSIPFYSYSIP